MGKKIVDVEYLKRNLKNFRSTISTDGSGHTHNNKDVLDKLSEDTDGNLLYDGAEIEGGSDIVPTKLSELENDMDYQDGTQVKNIVAEETSKITTDYSTMNSEIQKNKKDIEDIKTNNPAHDNRSVLDKLSESDDGNLLYDGTEIKGGSGSGQSITIDKEMSDTSENAVQNKVIKAYVDNAVGSSGGSGEGDSSKDELVKMSSTSTDSKYLKDFVDGSTIEADTDNEKLIVKKLDGQKASIEEINYLSGVTSNIQEQINSVDKGIVKEEDVLDKATYKGSNDGIVKSADTLAGLTHTVDELDSSVDNAHKHDNKDVLDKIVSNGVGEKILADNGEYVSVLHIGTDEPEYTSQIWVDTTYSSNMMKVYDGNEWVQIVGISGKDGITYTPRVGTVTSGDTASVAISINADTSEAVFDFVVPKGKDGENGADGKDGADGVGVRSVDIDKSNTVTVTYTDNTEQTVGKVNVDVQGDFLTESGFGNLRFYQGHFQYYDVDSETWIDTAITPENIYIKETTPQSMRRFFCIYDTGIGHYKLKFQEPSDSTLDGQVFCMIEKVIIRRKLGEEPTDENDGELVLEVQRKDFGSYGKAFYIDESFTPNEGETWYYKAFPVSTDGLVNKVLGENCDSALCSDYYLYGFKIDQRESNPASMITYPDDVDNRYFDSAYMDYTTGVFNYGDWKDAWFIKDLKPCMLKYDGTVDYELDPNDYTKKLDGTDSHVANINYEGNAMMGIPKVYWKIVDNGDNTANVYVCNKKLNDSFHCWSHIDSNGNEIDYCYMPIYNGYNDGTRLRSISGLAPTTSKTADTEIALATANNLDENTIWYTEVYSDRQLINILLLLIGKNANVQTVFGQGRSGTSDKQKSGYMNTKGLFWGQKSSHDVKVFGMEHWWGNTWRRIAGWMNCNGTQKVKLTYGQSDGSTADGYNTTGEGYISVDTPPTGSNGGYISAMNFSEYGFIPSVASGSSTTYYCDKMWFDNSVSAYACVGGYDHYSSSGYYVYVGAFCACLSEAVSYSSGDYGASVSCKPLAQKG